MDIFKNFYNKLDTLEYLKNKFPNIEFRFIINKELNGYYLLWEEIDADNDSQVKEITNKITLELNKHIDEIKQKNIYDCILPIQVINLKIFLKDNEQYNFLKHFKRVGTTNFHIAVEEIFEMIMALDSRIYVKGSYALIVAYNENNKIDRDINFNVPSAKVMKLCINNLEKWLTKLQIDSIVKYKKNKVRNRATVKIKDGIFTFETFGKEYLPYVVNKENEINTFEYEFIKSKNKSKFLKNKHSN